MELVEGVPHALVKLAPRQECDPGDVLGEDSKAFGGHRILQSFDLQHPQNRPFRLGEGQDVDAEQQNGHKPWIYRYLRRILTPIVGCARRVQITSMNELGT